MPRDWKSWLKANAPASQFENTVGSTSWLDLRAKRDQQREWINDIPKLPKGPRIYLEPRDEDDIEPEGLAGLDERF